MHTIPLYTWTSTSSINDRSIRRFVRACEQTTMSIFGYFFVPYNYASYGKKKKTNFGQITNNLYLHVEFSTN